MRLKNKPVLSVQFHPEAAPGPHDAHDIFEDFFSSFVGGRQGGRSGPRRGADIRVDVTISFEEAAFGVEKEIEFNRLEVCDVCHGNGTIISSFQLGQ